MKEKSKPLTTCFNVRGVDIELARKVKSHVARQGMTMRGFVIRSLQEQMKREGQKA